MTSFNWLVVFYVERGLFLAGEAKYIHMGRRFRRHGADIDSADLLLPMAVIVCAVGIAWLVSRYFKLRAERNADNPQALFAELCRAHGLNRPNQQLLRTLANAYQLPSPAQLFVEPERFDIEALGKAFESRTAQIVELRSRLFADTAGEGPEVSQSP